MVSVGGGVELVLAAVQLAAPNAASESTTGNANVLHRRADLDSMSHTAERPSPPNAGPAPLFTRDVSRGCRT